MSSLKWEGITRVESKQVERETIFIQIWSKKVIQSRFENKSNLSMEKDLRVEMKEVKELPEKKCEKTNSEEKRLKWKEAFDGEGYFCRKWVSDCSLELATEREKENAHNRWKTFIKETEGTSNKEEEEVLAKNREGKCEREWEKGWGWGEIGLSSQIMV